MIKTLLKLGLALVSLFAAHTTRAQECEWIFPFGGPSTDYVQHITVDDSNDAIVAARFFQTITIGLDTLYPPKPNYLTFCLIKFASDGTVKWIKQPHSVDTTIGTSTFVSGLETQGGNYYVMGTTKGNLDFGNGVKIPTVYTTQDCYFIVKYNRSGVAQWVRTYASGAIRSNYTFTGNLTVDYDGNPILIFGAGGTWVFSSTDSISTGNSDVINIMAVKYSTNGSLLWAKKYGVNTVANRYIGRMGSTDSNNNIYITAACDSSFMFGSQNIAGKGHAILKIDSAGNPKKGIMLPYSRINSLTGFPCATAFPDGRVVFVGFMADSMDFGNSKKLYSKGAVVNNVNMIAAFFENDLTCKWAVQEDPQGANVTNAQTKVRVSQSNIFFGGTMSTTSIFGTITLTVPSGKFPFFVTKMDTVGNFLWAFNDKSTGNTYALSPDLKSATYIGGGFQDTIEILGKKQNAYSTSMDAFVAKISDYSITRGKASAGPYCAGDSIKIPFVKSGTYDVGNQFIAQLSDSAGNFTGAERELGRLTGVESDTIKGILPLFNVATTNKYRIRVVSTKPIVQSYYKIDTLRLLIYSKDTANAGPDVTICKGQSVTLGTTGGSKWRWNPPDFMMNPADTSNRQARIKPDSTTEYRIIISDSSGCGVTDTDYVMIKVRPGLKLGLRDTVHLCLGRLTTLKAQAHGGDSNNYYYQWMNLTDSSIISDYDEITIMADSVRRFRVVLNDSCSIPDTSLVTVVPDGMLDLLPMKDTTICFGNPVQLMPKVQTCDSNAIKYVWDNALGTGKVKTVSPTVTTTYTVIARDSINNLSDTTSIKITVLPDLKITASQDTALCLGQYIMLHSQATGGNGAYQYRWTTTVGNAGAAKDLFYNGDTTVKFWVKLTDGCTANADSASVTITKLPKMVLTVAGDTTLCLGRSAPLKATATGGKAAQYKIVWTADNSNWTDSNFYVYVKPDTTTVYTAMLTDGCSAYNDSGKVNITVRPALKVTVSPDTSVCKLSPVQLRATVTGGLPGQYKIKWTSGNNGWNDTNFTTTVVPLVSSSYLATVTDGCTVLPATAKVKITLKPQIGIVVSAKDSVCGNEPVNLTAKIYGGDPATYNLQWTSSQTAWTSNKTPATDTPKTTTLYRAKVSDKCNPPEYDSVTVVVKLSPVAGFTVSQPSEGCSPVQVTFTDTSVNHDTALNVWKILFAEATGTPTFTRTFEDSGAYNITLEVANASGCTDIVTKSNAVRVHENPVAGFDVKPDIKELGQEIQLYNHSRRVAITTWDFGDGNTVNQNGAGEMSYLYKDTGLYLLKMIVASPSGCLDSAWQWVRIFDNYECFVPSAFTPSRLNELNNVFVPVCNNVKTYTLRIFDRWGQKVADCNDCAWNGRVNDVPVPAGMYMYRIDVTTKSGDNLTLHGSLMLIR